MNTLPRVGARAALPHKFRHAAIAAGVIAAYAVPVTVQAQMVSAGVVGADVPLVTGAGGLNYVGALSQIGVGVDRDSHIHGQLSRVLTEDALSAWIAQGWLSRGSGGVRLDYNWVAGVAGQDEKPAADSVVRKVFAALDRNQEADRKLTIGFGLEKENWFGSVSYSHGLSDRRWLGPAIVTTETAQQNGTDAGRPYVDTLTTSTSTRIFERAYDHGVGVRAGHFYSDALLRVGMGLDREWGGSSARQNTVSVSAEKFFAGSPHSLAVSYEQFNRSGEFETRGSGSRIQLMYRFSFGGPATAAGAGWRDRQIVRQVPVAAATEPVTEVAQAPVPKAETRKELRIVKTTASMTSDAFFAFNRADLSAAAKGELDRLAETLRTTERAGNIRIAGHSCDIGPDAYNMKLSLRRAIAVRDYLVARGKLSPDMFVVEGLGKSQPKYPNTAESRARNRRVDLEFVQYQDKTEEVLVPVEPASQPPVAKAASAPAAVQWRTEVIEQEPAWVRRALRNTVPHKQTVDTYRGAEVTRTTTSSRVYPNRSPVAQVDALALRSGVATPINVLANDSDPDGNALRIVSVGQPAHGTAVVSGDAIVYTSTGGFFGVDTFNYTVDDGAGGQASASVTVTVQVPNEAPLAQDDLYFVSSVGMKALNVLENDTDPDGDALSIASFTQPSTGIVTRAGNSLLFESTGPFPRTTFTYTVSDGRGGTSTATVILIDP